MANINDVSSIYANTQKQLQQSSGGAQPSTSTSGGPSFSDIVKSSLEGAVEAQHNSEKVSAQALVGNADMTDLVQAVNNAEVALDTVLAIRDRVVQAYEELLRTPI